jgi:NADH-quinone oxidoreductase subunit L
MIIWAIFLPLIGFLLSFFGGKAFGDRGAQIITCTGLISAAILSWFIGYDVIFQENSSIVFLGQWISVGDFMVDWSLRVDQLTAVMLIVITTVSACVHVYSVGYMSHDANQARFMSYLSLFTFAMLMLVTADNLIQLFFGWEGVGLASYLLIGFWNTKDSANRAAMKAFIVNRVGDFGLALGIFTIFMVFGSVQFDEIFAQAADLSSATFNFAGFDVHALTLACLLLFVGAMGKSAQLGLHTWLPDAMEGPTPVSALIHAATMVTAGVFLVARFSPLFEYAPIALEVVTYVGAATAIVAATIGMTQFDIKRVIAYSTMSQLGYMFFALGVSAYSAAMFHLMTHAFFKALLFLGAGSVIHAMSNEQDMRHMGGIWKKIPTTYALMWIGSLALAGMPFFAGYYSKDLILESAFADHSQQGMIAFWLGITAALLTAFYSWRLIFMTFHGKPRASNKVMSHVHESPQIMLIPLYVLAVGAIFAGYAAYEYFAGHHRAAFWGDSIKVLHENDTIEAAHHVPWWVKKLPIGIGLLGIFSAYLCYILWPKIAEVTKSIFKPVHALFFNKWYFDNIYDAVFLKSAWGLGLFFWKQGDGAVINRMGPDGIASLSNRFAMKLKSAQSGYVFHYVFIMVISVVALIAWVLYRSGMIDTAALGSLLP